MKLNFKKTLYIVIITIIILVIYITFIKKEEYLENTYNLNILNTIEENTSAQEKSSNDNTNKIVIYITGAIKNEGVYELEENSRIADIIEKAGGLTEESNINELNLACILQDGMKIHIPKKGENIYEKIENENSYITRDDKDLKNSVNVDKNKTTNKININTATQKELETLPGIGKSTALNIINYRNENGKFKSVEDIKKVSGIGDSKYSKIKDLIKV